MYELIKQEQFELEVLEYLSKGDFLKNLIFVGGTMLRLCYELNRYSIDLDFWTATSLEASYANKLKKYVEKRYTIKDFANKYYTLLLEISGLNYPRRLKIEIRKVDRHLRTDWTIAYSRHSNIQVLVRTIALEEAMRYKTEALLSRREIRDCFDIEFLLKKGIDLVQDKKVLEEMLSVINSFKVNDYKVKLGSLLEAEQRTYYNQKNFIVLKQRIFQLLGKNS